MTNWTTTPSDHFVYSPPTVRDWQRWGFQLGGSLVLWSSRRKFSRRAYHCCGRRLTVADAVFGVGVGAEIRFVVVCYHCGRAWDTGLSAAPEEGDSRMALIADEVAIEAAVNLNRSMEHEKQGS